MLDPVAGVTCSVVTCCCISTFSLGGRYWQLLAGFRRGNSVLNTHFRISDLVVVVNFFFSSSHVLSWVPGENKSKNSLNFKAQIGCLHLLDMFMYGKNSPYLLCIFCMDFLPTFSLMCSEKAYLDAFMLQYFASSPWNVLRPCFALAKR